MICRLLDRPFITLSSFQERATNVRQQSGALFVGIVPKVTTGERDAWENYTLHDEAGWIEEAVEFQKEWDAIKLGVSLPDAQSVHPGYIMQDDFQMGFIRDDGYGPFYPIWETSPLFKRMVNFNLGSIPDWRVAIEMAMNEKMITFGRMITASPGNALDDNFLTRFFATMLSIETGENTDYQGDPFSYAFLPIYDSHKGETSVASVFAVINWAFYLKNILPTTITGITVVLSNGCDRPYTYMLDGSEVILGGAVPLDLLASKDLEIHEVQMHGMRIARDVPDLPFLGGI